MWLLYISSTFWELVLGRFKLNVTPARNLEDPPVVSEDRLRLDCLRHQK